MGQTRVVNEPLRARHEGFESSLGALAEREGAIKRLWHGSRTRAPRDILDHPDGFLVDHAQEHGLRYGRGLYFADRASYPDRGFAYTQQDGTRQLIRARVVLGVVKDYGAARDGRLRARNLPRDVHCVSGDDGGGGKMYVVYRDAQALPECVVTYR